MRQLDIPSNDKAGQGSVVLERVHAALAIGMQVRVLVVLARVDSRSPWYPASARFDLAREGDPAATGIRPSGNVMVIEQIMPGEEFESALRSSLTGGPFVIGDMSIEDHGMESGWSGLHHTFDWFDEGTLWPCISLSANREVGRRLYVHDPIEAEGPISVFRNLEELLRHTMRFRNSSWNQGGRDLRYSRFQIYIWDYRGRIDRFQPLDDQLLLHVSPPERPELRLVGVVSGESRQERIAIPAPGHVTVPLGEPMRRADLILRHGDDVVAEQRADLPMEFMIAMLRSQNQGYGHVLPVPAPALRRRFRSVRGPAGDEYVVSEEAYEDILGMMQHMALVMERSPGQFVLADEESIRTHFLVTLNAQYQGGATGETFNASGKTDILVRAHGENVFIAEFKFWRGPESLTKALDQLLGYLSWRDTKAAVVLLVRETAMSTVLAKVPETLREHPRFAQEHVTRKPTWFRGSMKHPADASREAVVTVMVFNVPKPP